MQQRCKGDAEGFMGCRVGGVVWGGGTGVKKEECNSVMAVTMTSKATAHEGIVAVFAAINEAAYRQDCRLKSDSPLECVRGLLSCMLMW